MIGPVHHSASGSISASNAGQIGPNMPRSSKQQGHLRKSAGQIWSDTTLDDWPSNDFRLFCGDLGNEVTDELLASHFRKYKSFNKSRVIRDKRTGKSKGYGFVSFSDPEDMMKGLREMNQKYVGNRPIKLKKSEWKDREIHSGKSISQAELQFAVPTKLKSNKKFKKLKKSHAFSEGSDLDAAALIAQRNALVMYPVDYSGYAPIMIPPPPMTQ
eukprot:GHVL01032045.1.p1 GENE.GHVL01032045.1~~GHVL01032045.1.p1  ORF type:complete len:214 (-),score=46.44 GHVL01032045.1:288-929(-)